MGSSDSSCCGSKNGVHSPDIEDTSGTVKKKRSSKSYINTDPSANDYGESNVEHKKKKKAIAPKSKCIATQDISQCESLKRIIKVMNEYNKWLHSNSLLDDKHLRVINDKETDYDQYDNDINQLIISIDNYSMKTFLRDSNHIKQKHYYKYTEMRQFCIENNVDSACNNHNCFSMKHYFLRNKQNKDYNRSKPFEMLTNLHIYMFHSIYISQLNIQHIEPPDAYVVTTYVEHTQRTLNIKAFSFTLNCKMVHLISLYFGGEMINNQEPLNTVSALRLARFMDKTFDDKTLNTVWSQLDRNASNSIDAEEVDDILSLIVLFMISVARKESGSDEKLKINKDQLKQSIQPIAEWMKKHKMNDKPEIKKEEFQIIFSEWLKEYHVVNGGIIADDEMQTQLLKKYKVNYDANEGDDYDRLVVDCEHLIEKHSSSLKSSLNPDVKSFKPDAQ